MVKDSSKKGDKWFTFETPSSFLIVPTKPLKNSAKIGGVLRESPKVKSWKELFMR